jgi:AraC-like DNA-binding protein
MKWITREKPKIDRIACPWLIRKFVDKDAEIIYVPFSEVVSKSEELDAIPFDIPDVEFTHYNSECTFDYIVRKYKIDDPAIRIIANIVRGADTDQHTLAPEAAGLWAISAGLAYNTPDDYELLEKGMLIYDALYSWASKLYNQTHLQNPFENLLLEVFHKVIQSDVKRKTPTWVKNIKEIIQDQIDINFALSLTEIASSINVNPSYISREFSKYFENLSFGEYIRKVRIEKATQMMQTTNYSLTEIAFLTGFSDQSHFTRIFKKHTGQNPSEFKKNITKK